MRVSIIGAGYVGLVSGACLAEKGHSVVCVDNDRAKIDLIRKGIPPFFEEGLEELLGKTRGTGLEASTNLAEAVSESEITLIAVGTPFDGRTIDLSYIRQVTREIGMVLKNKGGYHVVAVKSTVVPGTTDGVVLPILENTSGKRAGQEFGVGVNPEFLTEGKATHDFMNPDRIVIGGIDDRTQDRIDTLYESFGSTLRIRTNNKTAEMIKYASNALLATMISFSNEFANLCTRLGGIDIKDVMAGVHTSEYLTTVDSSDRIRTAPITKYLEAGCGFGGSCLPKDVKALISHAEAAGMQLPLLSSVIAINAEQPNKVIELLGKHFESPAGLNLAILGLSFKPGTDDVRESPAFPIMHTLLDRGANLRAYDPAAIETARHIVDDPRVVYCSSLREAVRGVDAVLLLTRWKEFLELPEILRTMVPAPVLIDGRRLIDKSSVERYEGIGL